MIHLHAARAPRSCQATDTRTNATPNKSLSYTSVVAANFVFRADANQASSTELVELV
jgi:hypothetical protein